MSILDHMTTAEYMKIRYGNRHPRHWWGIAHRRWLLDSGRYVRTSSPSLKTQRALRCNARAFREGFMYGLGEAGPELIDFSGWALVHDETEAMRRLTCDCGRIACRHHTDEQ